MAQWRWDPSGLARARCVKQSLTLRNKISYFYQPNQGNRQGQGMGRGVGLPFVGVAQNKCGGKYNASVSGRGLCLRSVRVDIQQNTLHDPTGYQWLELILTEQHLCHISYTSQDSLVYAKKERHN